MPKRFTWQIRVNAYVNASFELAFECELSLSLDLWFDCMCIEIDICNFSHNENIYVWQFNFAMETIFPEWKVLGFIYRTGHVLSYNKLNPALIGGKNQNFFYQTISKPKIVVASTNWRDSDCTLFWYFIRWQKECKKCRSKNVRNRIWSKWQNNHNCSRLKFSHVVKWFILIQTFTLSIHRFLLHFVVIAVLIMLKTAACSNSRLRTATRAIYLPLISISINSFNIIALWMVLLEQ